MPLEPLADMIQHARQHEYAVGYFESWNLESLEGVIDAAEETGSPIIIGFNGEFLTRPGRLTQERLEWYARLGKAAAESTSVPCALIFNECSRDDRTRQAVLLGFNIISISDPEAERSDYVKRVGALTEYAHAHGAGVEIEIGELPSGASGHVDDSGFLTDPGLAGKIVDATGVDLLAVSVGNAHIVVKGRRGLDFDHLAAIQERVSVPLVLHGGSGIPDSELSRAVSLGVVKVNYGTYLKQRYLKAMRDRLESACVDPHRMLGYGGDEDVLVAARQAVRDAVLERIGFLGCCGKA